MSTMRAAVCWLLLACAAPAGAQSLADHQGFRAGPDMSAQEIAQACVGFAEAASGDGTDLYVAAHSDFRYCLTDLRRAADGDQEALIGEALTGVLQEADPVIQMHAFLELGRIGHRPAAPFAAEALAANDWRVVLAAARALGALGDDTHVPALRDAMARHEGQAWEAAFDAYLVLGGAYPADQETARWLETLSRSERRDHMRFIRDQREFLRERYAEAGGPGADGGFWMGDRNLFGQPMGGGIDVETGDVVEACPDHVFVDARGDSVDLTREPPLDPGILSPGAEYELAAPGGGRLVGTRDTNPQWLGAGPARLRWVDGEGAEALVYEQPIAFLIERDTDLIVIAGPGAGPSNGAILRLSASQDGPPALTKLHELTGIPAMAARFGPNRYAVMTLEQSAVALGQGGGIEALACRH